jgi:hypothetical protein
MHDAHVDDIPTFSRSIRQSEKGKVSRSMGQREYFVFERIWSSIVIFVNVKN